MRRDDLLNHTLRWVFGYCWCYNMAHQQFDANSHQFHDWMHRVHNTIWRYLHGKQTLDASCSDLECTMALEARALFGSFINKDKE